jgi:outer membrane lipoprotein carrier protein
LSHSWTRHLAGLVAASVLALPLAAGAAALDQFTSFVSGTKAARGEFIQRQVVGMDGVQRAPKESAGTFVFARPGRFIWTYHKPYEQVLQADGDWLYVFDKDLNQVIVRPLGDALGSSPAAILFGSNELAKDFALKEAGRRDGMDWLEATPKTRDTAFERIGIGMKDGVPQAMELRDSFGQVTMLTFQNFERNPQLRADQFRFVVPKGADVLQQ